MKYKKASDVLPAELVNTIQDYIQGEYIYIPRREKKYNSKVTAYQRELQKRDANIYLKVLEGTTKKELAGKYNLSQSSIRRIVLAQRKGYVVMQEKIKLLLQKWGIEEVSVSQVYDSAWQIGEDYILKVYENKENLERNIRILQLLGEREVPVAEVVSTAESEKYILKDGKAYVLTKRLTGNNIVEFDKEFSLAGKLGQALGKLHVALAEIGEKEVFWENSLLAELRGWVREVFEKKGWKDISREEFERVVCALEESYDKLPVQLIHRDVHFGNFLFHEGEFSGYIDFDLSQKNIRIFDICYFLLGLLCEEEKREISFEEWLEISKQVFKGYAEYISLCREELQAVPYVMEAIELLFGAWFIQCEDDVCLRDALGLYEFVKGHENEVRNMLSVTKSLQF